MGFYKQQVAVWWLSKTFHGNIACRSGQLKAYLAYLVKANEQSVYIKSVC